ncbi:MAG: VWA domain-containing protein [Acidobacteria bacterium]|nr:VWA domain-containing protein [Acidobacteriota bacterium]
MRRYSLAVLVGVGLIVAVGFGGVPAGAQEIPEGQAVFQGEVRVEVVDLLVSVVDSIGEPVRGLSVEDFEIFQDGEAMDLTFFSEEGHSETQGVDGVTEGITPKSPPHRLILVFDRISLEKKARKRTLKGLEGFLESRLSPDTLVMVALAGGGIEIVQPFTDDLKKVKGALEAVNVVDFTGDTLRGRKRVFNRSMSNAHTVQVGAFKPSVGDYAATLEGLGLEDGLGTMQADGYLGQVNQLRDFEFNRIFGALIDLETIVRGTSGTTGRRDVVWIGEDLFIKPGIDAYGEFFSVFQRFSSKVNIRQPEVWAEDKELSQQFEAIARMCQGMGAVVHVLDAADRNRYAQEDSMNRRPISGLELFAPGDTRNMTFRQGSAQAQNLVEGGRFLARATGGTSLSGSRDVDEFFDLLGAIIGGTYWLGYNPPQGLDGQLHDVAVGIKREGLVIHSADRVPAETVHQRLADLAAAEMLLPQGENPLGFEVQAGKSEERDDGKVVQTFRLLLSSGDIVFAENGDQRTAQLAVAVVMKEIDGEVKPPSVFQLPVSVPVASFRDGAKIASSFRLLVDERLQRVSVALRDELSGISGCQSLSIVAP